LSLRLAATRGGRHAVCEVGSAQAIGGTTIGGGAGTWGAARQTQLVRRWMVCSRVGRDTGLNWRSEGGGGGSWERRGTGAEEVTVRLGGGRQPARWEGPALRRRFCKPGLMPDPDGEPRTDSDAGVWETGAAQVGSGTLEMH